MKKFIKVIDLMEDSDEFNREYGLLSNIPICCVDYYIDFWSKQNFDACSSFNFEYHKKLKNYEYVACPSCLKNNRKNELRLDEDMLDSVIKLFEKYKIKYEIT